MLIEGIRGPSTIAVLVVTILSVTSSTILDSEPTDSQTPEGAINEVVGSGNIDPFVGWQVGGMSETHPEPIAERSATEDERTDTKSEAGYADDMPVQAPVCLWTTICLLYTSPSP